MAVSPKHYLVSFDSISASVGGSDISSVMEMRLTAAANSVPQLTLLVDAGASKANGNLVDVVSLANASGILGKFRSMMRTDGGTLSLSLTCTFTGPGGSNEKQSLSLNGWMLTDVAMAPVQRDGVCTAALTFQHPICKAHFGGAVPGLVAVPATLDGALVGSTNPLAVFINSLYMYGALQRETALPVSTPGASSPDATRANLLQRLTSTADALRSTVKWTHGGLPAFAYLAGWGADLCRGLSCYAAPSSGNSVLHALLGGLVPECSLALGGDYTKEALELGPFEPWAESSLAISDSDIISLELPQADPTPISGVQIRTAATNSALGDTYMVEGCQAGEGALPAASIYIPQSELGAPYLYGPIQQFSEPGWMVGMSYSEDTEYLKWVSDTVCANAGVLTSAVTAQDDDISFGVGGGKGGSARDYAAALMLCAKAYYETSLMKDWAFTIESRLMFSVGGGILCPGKVLGVNAGSSEVLGGYITGVEHVISVPSRVAVTRIMCTHPRFGSLPPAITSRKNALYT